MSAITIEQIEPAVAAAPASRELPPSMVERMTLILDAFVGSPEVMLLEEITEAAYRLRRRLRPLV